MVMERISKAVLILNSQAGRKQRRRAEQIQIAQRELEKMGFSVILCETAQPGHGAAVARDAIESGADLIVVCGGDGTINDVVSGMAHSQVPLAVLPGGTANMLARELGIPLDIAAAARAISRSVPRKVALGKVGQRYFLSLAGVGFDAGIINKINLKAKKLLGMASYVMEAFRQLVFEPPTPFYVYSEGRLHQATFACISRSQHYGPIRMVREADLFSDQFYVYCFQSGNPLRYLLYAWTILVAGQSKLPDLTGFPSRQIRCERMDSGEKPVFLQVDGEFAGQLPCTIEIVPDALTLMVPANFTSETNSHFLRK
jgi:diacylglycerol kinase (ATP)